jgi:hypothetical protein
MWGGRNMPWGQPTTEITTTRMKYTQIIPIIRERCRWYRYGLQTEELILRSSKLYEDQKVNAMME